MKKILSAGMKGSVTVESAMLMPFYLGLIFLILTMSITLYDRCIYEQESIRLEVMATAGKGFGSGLEAAIREKEETFPGEHLLLEDHSFQVEKTGNKVRLVRRYAYIQPSNIIGAFEALGGQKEMLTEQEIKLYDPVKVIRTMRKVEKLKEVLDKAGKEDEETLHTGSE